MLNPAFIKFTGFYHSIYPNLAVKSALKTRMFCAPCDLEDNFDRRNFFERFTARGRPSGKGPHRFSLGVSGQRRWSEITARNGLFRVPSHRKLLGC
jgi:hypothetical protein